MTQGESRRARFMAFLFNTENSEEQGTTLGCGTVRPIFQQENLVCTRDRKMTLPKANQQRDGGG